MTIHSLSRAALILGLMLGVSGCGNWFGGGRSAAPATVNTAARESNLERQLQNSPDKVAAEEERRAAPGEGGTIWDLFANRDDPNTTIRVNKYLWQASLEVLNFLPVQAVDPFSGVITMGYGTPPGGGRAYRATVYVQDPALEARSLKVALATRGGPVDAATTRAVEDAIMTRARQLRIRDRGL